MAENKDFEAIMKEITGGLSGDTETDLEYLKAQGEKYKDHEYAREILRACGRLLYQLLPEEKIAEISEYIEKDQMGFDAALDEIRFTIFKKDYDKALKMLESMIAKYEDAPFFENDAVSDYFCFREPMEEILYRIRTNTEKDLRQSPINYVDMYYLYGSLLVEMNRPEDAETALKKAMRWNPGNPKAAFEHAETYKLRGLIDEFGRLTREIFKIVYRPEDLARCYRNMGYYFVETKDYRAAVCCLLFSESFDKNDLVQSELYYISQVSGEDYEPTGEELKEIILDHDLPFGLEMETLITAYECGKAFYERGDLLTAKHLLEIFLDFVDDETAEKMMEDINAKLGEEEL